jgi:hypothetical protein
MVLYVLQEVIMSVPQLIVLIQTVRKLKQKNIVGELGAHPVVVLIQLVMVWTLVILVRAIRHVTHIVNVNKIKFNIKFV